jgi:hypothetical protein
VATDVVWALNFDADDEFAGVVSSGGGASLRARSRDLEGIVRRLGLVLPGHRVLGDARTRVLEGAVGRCFSPTPRALEALRMAGIAPPAAPTFDALRHANDRAFSQRLACKLGIGLVGSTWIESVEEAKAFLAGRTGDWLAKRRHTYAGRGQRALRAQAVEDADWAFLEPRVEITCEFALHGFVDDRGRGTFGEPTVQVCGSRGVWIDTRREAGELAEEDRRSLSSAAQHVSEALASSGYFGPFGIDAYRHRRGADTEFVALSEINARYTMGWGVGMGALRPDLP